VYAALANYQINTVSCGQETTSEFMPSVTARHYLQVYAPEGLATHAQVKRGLVLYGEATIYEGYNRQQTTTLTQGMDYTHWTRAYNCNSGAGKSLLTDSATQGLEDCTSGGGS